MRGILSTISTYAILGGLLMSFFGAKEVYERRNVNAEPQLMQLQNVALTEGEVSFVSIAGGFLDLENAYEYQMESKSGSKLGNADVYIPVVTDEGAYKYTLKIEDDENIETALDQENYVGLLESGSEMPGDLIETYTELFPDNKLLLLDTDYQAGDENTSLKTLLFFLGLLGLGILIKVWLHKTETVVTTQETSVFKDQ